MAIVSQQDAPREETCTQARQFSRTNACSKMRLAAGPGPRIDCQLCAKLLAANDNECLHVDAAAKLIANAATVAQRAAATRLRVLFKCNDHRECWLAILTVLTRLVPCSERGIELDYSVALGGSFLDELNARSYKGTDRPRDVSRYSDSSSAVVGVSNDVDLHVAGIRELQRHGVRLILTLNVWALDSHIGASIVGFAARNGIGEIAITAENTSAHETPVSLTSIMSAIDRLVESGGDREVRITGNWPHVFDSLRVIAIDERGTVDARASMRQTAPRQPVINTGSAGFAPERCELIKFELEADRLAHELRKLQIEHPSS